MSKWLLHGSTGKSFVLLFSLLAGLFCLTLDAEAKPKDKSKTDRSILVVTIPFSPNSIQSQIDTLLETKTVSPRRERLIRWFLLSPAWEQREGETGGDDAWVRFIRVKSAVNQAAKGLHEVRLNALMEVLDDKEHLIHLYRHKTPRAVVAYVESKLEFEAYVENLLPLLSLMKAMQVDIELITMDEYKRRRRKIRTKRDKDSNSGRGARFEF
jgi:hypothetical protein